MPMMYGWNGDWGGMLLAMILNAALWIGLMGVLIWAVSRFFAQRMPSGGLPESGPSALEILRQRYARGELDATTFERMRRQLETPTTASDALAIRPER